MVEPTTESSPGKAICLIAGLGNPGKQYRENRHNAGLWFLNLLAAKHGLAFRNSPRGNCCRLSGDAGSAWLLYPGTYMNVSGVVVARFSDYYDLITSELLLVHDDIDLPVAQIRLKYGGGHGGHNGVRNVIEHCGRSFWRLRIGVGHPGDKSLVHNYVLSDPSGSEANMIKEKLGQAALHVEDFLVGRFERVQRMLNFSAES